MSEAIWIELIKIIPTFVWLGLGVAALITAKRLLAQQAHRMTRVESPFVSVDFAQDAIAQAFNRGPEAPASALDDAPAEGPLQPHEVRWRQEVTAGTAAGGWGTPQPGGPAGLGTWTAPLSTPEDTDKTHVLRPSRKPDQDSSDEDDLDLSSLLDGDVEDEDDGVQTAPADREPVSAETPPSGVPVYPQGAGPVYAPIPAQQSFQAMYPPQAAAPAGTTAFRPPSYYAVTADPQRGLRAATRLAGAADLLQGGAILWVDDHPQWNEPLIRLFRTAGMRVDPVGTTDEALRFLDRGTYDLVITDLRRERDPGDGVAGMALLDRMVARGIPTPAVVFSDNPQVRTMSHPRAAATTNNPEELVDRVVDLVGHRRNAIGQSQNRGGLFFGNG
ncbi:response regulator [Glycomyces rhizosphaerae]|uniref:Response regulator n=1 Tax=Glycomyces rhizosphaerae TaxID=2054422 RepID=A0ABV7PT60_9ACTN